MSKTEAELNKTDQKITEGEKLLTMPEPFLSQQLNMYEIRYVFDCFQIYLYYNERFCIPILDGFRILRCAMFYFTMNTLF